MFKSLEEELKMNMIFQAMNLKKMLEISARLKKSGLKKSEIEKNKEYKELSYELELLKDKEKELRNILAL